MSRLFGSIKHKMSKNSGNNDDKTRGNPFADTSAAPFVSSAGEAPPAYTVAPVSREIPTSRPRPVAFTDNDKYAFLSAFDTIFLVDDSGSMAGRNWSEVRDVLANIAPVCTARDKDGIDLYFLNHRSGRSGDGMQANGGYYNICSAEDVNAIFNNARPTSSTPTAQRLNDILSPYVRSLQRAANPDTIKPINIIVITDGCPSDFPDEIIRDYARRLDNIDAMSHQVGIQFFQVGTDREAAEHLRQLDDDLKGARDMVDTVSWSGRDNSRRNVLEADGILKVVLGAVVRRLDAKPQQ